MDVECKRLRRTLATLRGGSAALRIETGDCMMEMESDFLIATKEKKVAMILDQACRNVNVGKSMKKHCGSIYSFDRQN